MTRGDGRSGRHACCLVVDLSRGSSRLLERPEEDCAFLGGRGLGVALLAELGSPVWLALDPRQPFVLAAGPLAGTRAPSSSRLAAVGVSPLTGTIFDSSAGGRFGVRFRGAGLSALAVTGGCEEWSILVVDGRAAAGSSGPRVSLRLLSEVWPDARPADPSLTSSQLVAGLRSTLGHGFSLLFPSVAGRRGALLSCLCTDDRHYLGRGGLGLQLASRRVFAIAVAGDCAPGPADQERFNSRACAARGLIDAHSFTGLALPQFGTAVLMQLVNQAGALPVRNFQGSYWPAAEAISGEALRDGPVRGRWGCFGCTVRCRGRVGNGAAGGVAPEYQSLWALGTDCGIDDLEALQVANAMCGELGIDTVSTGATIACAMELSEQGALGRTIRFGDAQYMLRLVGEMGRVEGLGESLARGSARFAEEWAYPHLAMQVKKLELPAYDPRGMQGQGLGYATSNRGACHLGGDMLGPEILGIPKLMDRYSPQGKPGLLISLQHLSAVFDSAGLCKFAGFSLGVEAVAGLLSALWGRDLSARDLLQAGERIWNLERLWNLAAGFTHKDDMLPERLLREATPKGPSAGQVVQLEPMLKDYYRGRGWSAEGVPRSEKLEGLGLGSAARRLREAAAGGPVPGDAGRARSPGEGRRHLHAV